MRADPFGSQGSAGGDRQEMEARVADLGYRQKLPPGTPQGGKYESRRVCPNFGLLFVVSVTINNDHRHKDVPT